MGKQATHPQQQKLRKKTKRELEATDWFSNNGNPRNFGEAKKTRRKQR